MILEKYDSYEAFINSIQLENREGVYLLEINNGVDRIIQKVLFVE